MRGGGTATTRTLVGTVVPTLRAKLTLLTRGTLLPVNTVCRTCVRCSVVRLALPPAWPACPCWVWPCCVPCGACWDWPCCGDDCDCCPWAVPPRCSPGMLWADAKATPANSAAVLIRSLLLIRTVPLLLVPACQALAWVERGSRSAGSTGRGSQALSKARDAKECCGTNAA